LARSSAREGSDARSSSKRSGSSAAAIRGESEHASSLEAAPDRETTAPDEAAPSPAREARSQADADASQAGADPQSDLHRQPEDAAGKKEQGVASSPAPATDTPGQRNTVLWIILIVAIAAVAVLSVILASRLRQ
ncbi:MAG TPA: hypothetical protein VIH35_05035, partial [Kiritimatiellia bacterium]